MASVFNTYIFEQMQTLFPTYLLAAMVMLLVSVLLSHGLVSLLRDSLMGHHPTELLDLYLRQDVVLNALEEGLIATDSNGVIAYANQAARQLFQLPQPAGTEGCHFKDLFPASQADRVLTSGVPSYHRACTNGNHRLLVSEVPVNSQTGSHAVLTIINDQTDMETVMDELTGAKAMLDTLRAFNHEFLNKLHVILGYLQTGQTEEAIKFIINSNLVSSQSIRQTAD